jgi:hypothetical protein
MKLIASLLAEDGLPLQGPALAAVITAFGTIIAVFLRYLFKDDKRGDRSTAYAFALLEQNAKDCEERFDEQIAITRAAELKYERLLRMKDVDRERLAEECQKIRDERDAALLELARVRRSRPGGSGS